MLNTKSPFSLEKRHEDVYQQWRHKKLAGYPKQVEDIIVNIKNPFSLTNDEYQKIKSVISCANMVIYSIKYTYDFADKNIVLKLCQDLGLNRFDNNLCADEDSITSLRVIEGGRQQGYIPYSNKKLSWHTDGYYNLPEEQIGGVILHCVSNAFEGGENALLDHEMLYIHLRDQDPAYIKALMDNNVMTIPPNIENGVEIRGSQTGPVFSLDQKSGSLHMRYSARKRNIIWHQDEVTQAAIKAINEFLESDSSWIFRYQLQPGQGLISNNVLHNRTEFENNADLKKERLVYRGRYFDRVNETNLENIASK